MQVEIINKLELAMNDDETKEFAISSTSELRQRICCIEIGAGLDEWQRYKWWEAVLTSIAFDAAKRCGGGDAVSALRRVITKIVDDEVFWEDS